MALLLENMAMIENNRLLLERENLMENTPNITINCVSPIQSPNGSMASDDDGNFNNPDDKGV